MKREGMIEMIQEWILNELPITFSNHAEKTMIASLYSFALSYTNINETIKFIMLLLSLLALMLTVIGKVRDNKIKKMQMDKLEKEHKNKNH